jgi:hypothetical protein
MAISALTSAKLPEARRIKPGDEVITVTAGFPTTVAPIVQVGAVPMFIDADPITGNARCDQLEAAYSAGKTKAVMMAHALGNPFDLADTLAFCQKYDLWLVEDISATTRTAKRMVQFDLPLSYCFSNRWRKVRIVVSSGIRSLISSTVGYTPTLAASTQTSAEQPGGITHLE